jgi:N-acetylglucosamine kinase-like BadF-type ATPase
MSIFAGIDGGGSKTACLVGDEHSLLGSGVAGPSNLVRVGEPRAREAIHAAIRQACTQASVDASQIRRTCIGIAGGARAETADVVRKILSEVLSGEIEVVGDMVIAIEAAVGNGAGVVVIAGTGSMAYGRNAAGQTARAGGWGFAISDEGSAHWIGRAVVAAVMRAHDEDRGADLLDDIMKAWRVNTREQMILAANSSPPPNFAVLLPSVLSAADSQDPIAQDVLAQAGTELASLGGIVIGRLFKQGQPVPVATSGGVFRNAAAVRRVFYNNLRLKYPDVAVSDSVVDPVKGALELARKGMRPAH